MIGILIFEWIKIKIIFNFSKTSIKIFNWQLLFGLDRGVGF